MEIGSQIKKYRNEMGLSQEELAEKVYVSRQTISNWETGKNYPDIHSLLLLGSLFGMSLDQLIKGDVEAMKKDISKADIRKFDRYGWIFSILLISSMLSPIPLVSWLGVYGGFIWALISGVTLVFAVKIEKMKKDNDIHTYKEIVAFTQGKGLDEIQTQREIGKRPYQKILLAIVSGVLAFAVCCIMAMIFLR